MRVIDLMGADSLWVVVGFDDSESRRSLERLHERAQGVLAPPPLPTGGSAGNSRDVPGGNARWYEDHDVRGRTGAWVDASPAHIDRTLERLGPRDGANGGVIDRRWLPWPAALIGLSVVTLSAIYFREISGLIQQHWKPIGTALATAALIAGIISLSSASASRSPGVVKAPNAESQTPVIELVDFADRCARRSKRAYHVQLGLVFGVAGLLLSLVTWSVVMITMSRLTYGVALGTGSVGGTIVAGQKWQPFDRVNIARRQADHADGLALGLRRRLRTIEQIVDANERQKAEWQAVLDFTAAR